MFPVNAFTAGMDVITAIIITKTKLAFDFIGFGKNGMAIIPAIGMIRDKESINESVIDIWYGNYYLFALMHHFPGRVFKGHFINQDR
jgi:hypothetical protein